MEMVSASDLLEEYFNKYRDKILNEVSNAANSWFNIAYYVYEMHYRCYFSSRYANIAECCQAEFGFKKSTTYNFIKIVENTCCCTHVEYDYFLEKVKGWSYSQLVSMLSLSDKEREKASPDMSAREIKRLKTDSKRLENSESETVPAEIVIDEPAAPAPVEVVEPEPAAPAPADVVSKDEFERVLCDYDARIDKLYDDINEANEKYEAERDSNHRINIKLCNMTAERDKALQDIDSLKAEIKKLKAENRKLKSELKAIKDSSSS